MDEREIRRIYEERFARRPPGLHPSDVQLQYILDMVPSDHSAPILDAGCGTGRYADYLAGMGFRNVHAVDLFDRIDAPAVRYRRASIDNLPFDDGTFDFVFSNSVIFYLKDQAAGIRELGRVLASGGTLLFTAHTRYSSFTFWRQLKLRLGMRSARHLAGVEFRSAKEYGAMLRRSGLDVTLVDGYWASAYVVPLFRKALGFFGGSARSPARDARRRVPHSPPIARLLAVAGYHSVLAARKP